MKTLDRLQKKFYGYYTTFRGKFILLKNGILTKEEFILLEMSFAFGDWDTKHKNTYGTLDVNQKEIEFSLGLSSGFVSRYGKSLIKKGFWIKNDDGRIKIACFQLIEQKILRKIVKNKKIVDLQRYIGNSQLIIDDSQNNSTKGKDVFQSQKIVNLQTNNPTSIPFPFKDKNIFSEKEDGEWIDRNVHEDKNCHS